TNNNWTGTTINTGTLQIGDGGTNGSLGAGAINNNGVLTFNSANNFVIASEIDGGGALNQKGNGMVSLVVSKTYNGTTTIRNAAILRATADFALGTGTCAIGASQTDTCRLELLGGISLSNVITIFPRIFFGTGGGGTTDVADQILNVSGTNTLSPPS